MDESQRHYVKGRKPDTKASYCLIPFPSYSEEGKLLGQIVEQKMLRFGKVERQTLWGVDGSLWGDGSILHFVSIMVQ